MAKNEEKLFQVSENPISGTRSITKLELILIFNIYKKECHLKNSIASVHFRAQTFQSGC